MGRLYIAERRGIQGFAKIVALKRILPHLADSPSFARCSSTRRGSPRGSSTRTSCHLRARRGRRQYFIGMEYLPGEDCRRSSPRCQGAAACRRDRGRAGAAGRAGPALRARGARRAGTAASALVHRDVNPRNIFLTYHGVVKLLDFGVVEGAERQQTHPGRVQGQVRLLRARAARGGHVDRRTDVFCMGIVLWECLTGARLFEASTDAATIDAVRSRPIEAPSTLRPEFPPALDAIVLRALARDPERRFAERPDLSEELDRFPARADTGPPAKSVGRWMESIFGAERASLKKAISQGGPSRPTLERLFALDAIGPRAAPTDGRAAPARAAGRPRRSRARSGRRTSAATPRASAARIPSLRAFLVGRAAASLRRRPRHPGGRAGACGRAVECRTGRRAPARNRRCRSRSAWAGPGRHRVVAAVALRGERSFSERRASARRARPRPWRSRASRRAPTSSSTAAPAGCKHARRAERPGGRRPHQDPPRQGRATNRNAEQVTLAEGQSRTLSLARGAAATGSWARRRAHDLSRRSASSTRASRCRRPRARTGCGSRSTDGRAVVEDHRSERPARRSRVDVASDGAANDEDQIRGRSPADASAPAPPRPAPGRRRRRPAGLVVLALVGRGWTADRQLRPVPVGPRRGALGQASAPLERLLARQRISSSSEVTVLADDNRIRSTVLAPKFDEATVRTSSTTCASRRARRCWRCWTATARCRS